MTDSHKNNDIYEGLLLICKKYVGVAAHIFLDGILEKVKIDKDDINEEDLNTIAKATVEKARNYGLAPGAYDKPITRDIMALKKHL